MKRKGLLAIILLVSLVLVVAMTSSQGKIDLTGTWVGPTYVEGAEIELTMTLVLEHKGSEITGRINDDMGYIDSEITEVKLEKDVFTFESIANTPEGDLTLTFEMAVTGDKMEGKWDAEGMYYGEWTAERQK